MQRLSGSVGRNCANFEPDVLVVQQLLNQSQKLFALREPLRTDGKCGLLTINAIKEFQRSVVQLRSPDGCVDREGKTLQALNLCASGGTYSPGSSVSNPSPHGKRYTDNANEVPTKTTKPSAGDVVAALRQAWPELTEHGSHTLAAQFLHETGGGKYCFNWNLGNVKAKSSEPHMYLRNVWEVGIPAKIQADVAKAGGLAHVASAEEIKKRGWSCPPGKAVAVFEPPHAQSRFRAYPSLQDGVERWVKHHMRTAKKHTEYLGELNQGDCAAVAARLKLVGYYTGGEADYARGLHTKKAAIDKLLTV